MTWPTWTGTTGDIVILALIFIAVAWCALTAVKHWGPTDPKRHDHPRARNDR